MANSLSLDDWDAIRLAIGLIQGKTIAKLEGKSWKVYRAGTIIRIDIEDKE